MNLAALSLAALFVSILISRTTRLNVGILAVTFAWLIGVHLGGMSPDQVMHHFPVQLFLTLVA